MLNESLQEQTNVTDLTRLQAHDIFLYHFLQQLSLSNEKCQFHVLHRLQKVLVTCNKHKLLGFSAFMCKQDHYYYYYY